MPFLVRRYGGVSALAHTSGLTEFARLSIPPGMAPIDTKRACFVQDQKR